MVRNSQNVSTPARAHAANAITVLLLTDDPELPTVDDLSVRAPDLVDLWRSAFDDPSLTDLAEFIDEYRRVSKRGAAVRKAKATRERNRKRSFAEMLDRKKAGEPEPSAMQAYIDRKNAGEPEPEPMQAYIDRKKAERESHPEKGTD